MSTQAIVVFCAVPADFDAEGFGAALVTQSLAACVQIGTQIRSVYLWKGVVEKSEERLILIKTRRVLFAAVEAAIRATHPYEVPEIIAFDVSLGSEPYLNWIGEATTALPK